MVSKLKGLSKVTKSSLRLDHYVIYITYDKIKYKYLISYDRWIKKYRVYISQDFAYFKNDIAFTNLKNAKKYVSKISNAIDHAHYYQYMKRI